jgi:hypothetical protein
MDSEGFGLILFILGLTLFVPSLAARTDHTVPYFSLPKNERKKIQFMIWSGAGLLILSIYMMSQ